MTLKYLSFLILLLSSHLKLHALDSQYENSILIQKAIDDIKKISYENQDSQQFTTAVNELLRYLQNINDLFEELPPPSFSLRQDPSNLQSCDEIQSEITKLQNINTATQIYGNRLNNATNTLSIVASSFYSIGQSGFLAVPFSAVGAIIQFFANRTIVAAEQVNNTLTNNENAITQLQENASNCN